MGGDGRGRNERRRMGSVREWFRVAVVFGAGEIWRSPSLLELRFVMIAEGGSPCLRASFRLYQMQKQEEQSQRH